MIFRDILFAAGRAPSISRPTTTPQVILGSKLVGFIDAENNSQITNVSNAVSAYTDISSGVSFAQSTAGFRPAITTNAVTGRQIFRFDGVDDCLEYLSSTPTGWPTGATGGEIIAICAQSNSSPSVAASIAAYGGNASTNQRNLRVSNVAAPQFQVGNTTTGVQAAYSGTVFGNHLLRGSADGANIIVGADGDMSAAVPCVPATATLRARIGAGSNSSAGAFWLGDLSALFITNAALTTAEFNALAIWAGPRIWG